MNPTPLTHCRAFFNALNLIPVLTLSILSQGINTSRAESSASSIDRSQSSITEKSIEMLPMDLPEVEGSIHVPATWSIVTFFDAKEAVNQTTFVSQKAKDTALKAAQSIGAQSFKVSKYNEPYHGLNYSLSIAWSPIPSSNEILGIPQNAKSEVCARVLNNDIIPKIKSLSHDFSILENPTPIDTNGSGAWMTYNEKVIKNNNESSLEATLTTRLYLLIKNKYFIIISLSFPKDDDPESSRIGKDILGEMLKSFQIKN